MFERLLYAARAVCKLLPTGYHPVVTLLVVTLLLVTLLVVTVLVATLLVEQLQEETPRF